MDPESGGLVNHSHDDRVKMSVLVRETSLVTTVRLCWSNIAR